MVVFRIAVLLTVFCFSPVFVCNLLWNVGNSYLVGIIRSLWIKLFSYSMWLSEACCSVVNYCSEVLDFRY